ncbi:50S ribosomal protein L3 [Candidatus Woesearchaeota archaeon]|nr:50S ribosomal protein L3 [Candidatus Woesearchaeota archaeon]
MGKRLNPRHGSMQFWPRVRAKKAYARVRSLPDVKEVKPLVFAGYKAGMTHVIVTDNDKNSLTKGEKVAYPVTVVECPSLKISSVRFYEPAGYGSKITKELFFKVDKEFSKRAPVSKTLSTAQDLDKVDLTNVTNITVVAYTQPKQTGLGKKTPEIFEMGLGGSNEEKITFLKEKIASEITASDVLSVGSMVDVRAVTKGKGNQGPVKRFGISLRAKKSEKVKRGPGSLGGWKAQGHVMYRIAYSGQTGYHQRTQYNNLILGIYDDVEKVNPKGGFVDFGLVKANYVLVKGSIPGTKKRLVTLTAPLRVSKKKATPTVEFISIESKQGN